jgi:hypothetical protein
VRAWPITPRVVSAAVASHADGVLVALVDTGGAAAPAGGHIQWVCTRWSGASSSVMALDALQTPPLRGQGGAAGRRGRSGPPLCGGCAFEVLEQLGRTVGALARMRHAGVQQPPLAAARDPRAAIARCVPRCGGEHTPWCGASGGHGAALGPKTRARRSYRGCCCSGGYCPAGGGGRARPAPDPLPAACRPLGSHAPGKTPASS